MHSHSRLYLESEVLGISNIVMSSNMQMHLDELMTSRDLFE